MVHVWKYCILNSTWVHYVILKFEQKLNCILFIYDAIKQQLENFAKKKKGKLPWAIRYCHFRSTWTKDQSKKN